jgi:ABC-2 type transport system ATP-binding protein
MNGVPDHGLALEANGLGKRYGTTWALRDCALAVPAGRVVALVGPNGAGKTTLLHLAVGLATPTTGRVLVHGGLPAGGRAALAKVAFVAQDTALYPNLSVADTIRLAGNLNVGFDTAGAAARLAALAIPSARRVGRLSGGQRAQVALTLALAKRPGLLILDEPLSSLDPLARHEFMAALMAAVAEDGISVLFSSHVVAELERIADYLVVLTTGQVQVAGEVDELLDSHLVLTGPAERVDQVAARLPVVREQRAAAQAHLLVRVTEPGFGPPPGWQAHPVTVEELVLAYLRQPAAGALPGPRQLATGGARP